MMIKVNIDRMANKAQLKTRHDTMAPEIIHFTKIKISIIITTKKKIKK